MDRYPLFGEKSKAFTYLSGVRDVGQLEKTVSDGRWTWIKGRKRKKKTKLSLLLMVFNSSELKSKFAYHFKQILFSSWRYRQNFAKNKNKESMITGQQNERRWVCLVESEWWWNGVLDSKWKEESIRQGEGWGIYFEVKKPQNFERKIYKQRNTSWTSTRTCGKQSHVLTISMNIIIYC